MNARSMIDLIGAFVANFNLLKQVTNFRSNQENEIISNTK